MALISRIDDYIAGFAGARAGHLGYEIGQATYVAEDSEHPIGSCRYVLCVLMFHRERILTYRARMMKTELLLPVVV